MLVAFRTRLGARVLAKEVFLFRRGEPGMAVGGTDHAELVRVDAELLLELQTGLQRAARILVLQHVVLLDGAEVEVALVPGLVIGELVVGDSNGWVSPSPLIWVASYSGSQFMRVSA